MGFFGRQKEKNENEFGKNEFGKNDEETSKYCGLHKKINIWLKKSVIQRNGYQLLL